MKTGEDDTFLKHLQDALNSDPDNPSHHYNLGIFLWEKGGESKECMDRAVEHFISAAKLNPSNGPAFRFLGHYYRRVSFDSQRASKCYHRAVTLNPDDVEAGEGLCDLLDEEGKESLEVAVCREASEKSPRAFWAFRRLGYMQVHQKKWSEAVPSLQHAIRGYPTCADLWEALGLAYQRLGMFTASLKSYGRATELEDSRIFSLIESGNILLMLGSFAKGVEQFRLALKIEPNSIAAQYGLASGLLGFSRDCVNSGAFVWGSALLEEASDVAKANTCLAGNISSSWKLHGDIQMAYSKCFPWEYEGKGLETDEDSFKFSINSWKRKRLLAAVTANRSYQRALHLTPWQANFYTDISISLDLIDSLEEKNNSIFEGWQLPEKMSLGGLMLEGDNNEFWVVLGCLSTDNALKQHAFIRGLQLDVSDAVAWAYLGKLYRKVDEKLLARQAFDHARSIDPSLALPWAGMSIDTSAGSGSPEDAYESCLRAAYIMPLAEFQLGLGKLAVRTGHLLFPQVFGALQQAVQRAPYYPESHNLNGLAYEARSDYESAVSAYRNARNAMNAFTKTARKSHFTDISVNLARSLCQAGNAHEAACECEDLEKTGLLDNMGLQIYAVALWKLGRNDLALSVAKKLASNAKTMSSSSAVGPLELICKLMYNISGMSSTTANILKFPKDLFQGTKISSIVAVLSALDESGRLRSLVLHLLASPDVGVGFHSLLALGKLIRHGSEHCLGVLSAVAYLKKVLHIYPDSSLIRNHLSTLLLSSKEWKSSHNAIRCVTIEPTGCPYMEGAKSGNEILGSAAVACYASCTAQPKFSFPTCESQCMHRAPPVQQLQKWLHQEPCNNKARYLLVLSMLQKAREEKFPQHLCITLKRLVFGALSSEIFSKKDQPYEYQKFQLLLCASEICMQDRDYVGCIDHATTAMKLPISSGHLFFAHLQLCRAYAVQEDFSRLKLEYEKCMQLETDYHIGWISLKFIEARYKQQIHLSAIDAKFEACLEKNSGSQNQWVTIMDLVHAQNFMWDQDFLQAEQALMHGCSLREADFCLFLCHGTICMELARQRSGSHFLSLAANSLTRAQESSPVPLPIVSAVLAQAEASLGSRAKWERNLRIEWYSWPAEMRPAEVYFQMHLLARQSTGGSHCVELSQSPLRWILRAIHCNPSCSRYWRVLDKPGR